MSTSKKSSETIMMVEDVDDGILTMASSKISHCGSFHSAEDDIRTTGRSRASDRSAYFSTTETIMDTQSESWINEVDELDNRSVPFDEASVLPIPHGENNSTVYSIADCSEDPHDRHSLFDVEEAVARANRHNTTPHNKSASKHVIPRFIQQPSSHVNNKVSVPSTPRHVKSAPPLPPQREQHGTPSRRLPTKSQKRCTGIFIALFIFVSFSIIGLALVLYMFFLREPSSPQQVNQGSEVTPTPGFGYIDVTSNPAPKSPTSAPVPVPIPTIPPTIAFTRPPTVSGAMELIQFLATNFSVDFPDDPSAPNNQAVAWLVDESSERNTTLMVGGNKLVQRFALLTLELNWRNHSNASYVEELVDECQWEGVVCVGNTVTEISWGSQGLTGSIPPEVGLLTNLKYLDLSQNDLEGTIPENLYDLTKLQRLYLYQNELTGTLSESIGRLHNLTHVHLSHNQLSGSIPLSMRSTTDSIRPYTYVNFYSNNFSGPLPEGLNWRSLFYLDLGRNSFTGTLPQDMDNFISLRHLHLDHNRFNGTIPSVLPYVGSDRLEQLSLDHNDFTGEFPGEWAFLWHLVSLTVQNNSLTTRLPDDVCDMSVFLGGAMVEMSADCDICTCSSAFCQPC